MTDLESRTRYDPAEAEPRIAQRWLQSGLFHPEPEGAADENYSIAIPPPNVTGSLHMGHALNSAIQDVLIRHHRMRGRRAKWILGTDHAGIATQTQVERALREEGTSREELGREAFVERVWEWRERYGSRIIDQLRRMGASCDYDDERFTLDEAYAEAVLRVFVALFDEGLIYRDRYIVNWDPGSHSAISDLEVEEREVSDTLYSIRYDVEGGGEVVVATVRPETMLADTGVAVNPADERHQVLIGRTAVLPLVGRRLRIVADDYVKTDFGTGALKITPGHDPNDFEIGRRHGLEQVNVIGEDGRMTDEAGSAFAGLSALDAREAVVAALRAEGRIVAEEPCAHQVPFSHRSGERIEPLISLQWFMAMGRLAEPAIEAVTSGRVRIHPESHARVYLSWMEDIRPWCVSRQLWWGHQLPVYYCDPCEETYVAVRPPERCGACGGPVRREEDVLDTWFSSALWPFATLGWPQDSPELRAFYPTDVLLTARDILFLWVARMIMMGLRFAGDIPFSDVYVHSIIQAPDGRRMSKSLGTGIDPLELIDGGPRPPVFASDGQPPGEFPAYGADALRFGLLAMSATQDVRFSEEKVQQGSALANKLFNAARLVLLNVDASVAAAPQPRAIEDRWILSRLLRVQRATADNIAAFDFSHTALGLYGFVYAELCDWYLELIKPRLYSGHEASGDGRPTDHAALSATLLYLLRETLGLAHPVIPFVTEELWSLLPGSDGLLAGHGVGEPDETLRDAAAEDELERTIAAVRELRRWREAVGVAPGGRVPARLEAGGYEATASQLAQLARLELSEDDSAEAVARVTVPGGMVAILAGGDFDPAEAERRRDQKAAKLKSQIARCEAKLANPGFVEKAPPAVVAKERERLAQLRAQLAQL